MRSKFKWIFTLLVALSMQFSFAQEKTVTGVVSDKGGPLPGANVLVKSTGKGVQTDVDGKYSVKAKTGDVLVFSFSGYETKNVAVGASNSVKVTLVENVKTIDEVVVGQGVKKDKKKVGYQISTITSSQLEGKPQADVVRSLQGKVSGVQITNTGGLAGQTSNFVIRGNKSFTGSSQPLFIVDGVPFDTSNGDITGSFNQGAASSSNRFLDLDPSNIESLSILKGLSAAVTYGSAGKNGVVIVTTKGGKRNQAMRVDFSSSVYMSEVANLPEFTNKYGAGNNNITNTGNVGNWGAAFDANISAPHIYDQAHLNSIFPEYIGVTTPWVAAKNNVKDFFRKGFASSQSLLISGGQEKVNYAFNVSYTDEDGIVAHNNVTKYNLSGKFNVSLSDKFKIGSSFTYYNTKFTTPPVSAANGAGAISIFQRLLYIPRNYDINNLPYQNPITGASVYYRTDVENPIWLRENALNTQKVDRVFFTLEPSYDLTKRLNLTYRLGFDKYTDSQSSVVNKGGVVLPYDAGYLRSTTGLNTIIDQSLILRNKTINLTDNLGLDLLGGLTAKRDTYEQSGISSQGQILFGKNDHSFFSTSSNNDPFAGDLNVPLQWSNLLGAYVTADFGYKNYLYLNLSARKDWYSSLETENNSIIYPSASLSFLPSSAFSLKEAKIDLLKLRLAYGTSAGFPSLYSTRNRIGFDSNIYTSDAPIPGVSISNFLGNPNLKPELHKEYEFGTELEMFNGRLKLDGSVYYRRSEDQIVKRDLDPANGYTSTTINAGRIDSKGVEANVTVIPVRTKDFQWDVTGIFYKNKSEVISLPEGQENISISGFSNGIGNFAVEGQPFGVIMGTYALKDSNGNYLINPATGTLIASDDVGLANKIIGDPTPDYTLSVNNGFSYKGFNLGVLFEYTKGGDFYSNTIENLLRRGVTKDTESGRDNTYVMNGYYANPTTGEILLDGSGNQIPNNIQISANNIYFLNAMDPNSQNIYDATRLRLREITLGYTLPSKLLKGTGINGFSVNFVGSNLWMKAFNLPKYTNVDPDLISTGQGNGAGLDFQTAPQSRRYGMNVKINF